MSTSETYPKDPLTPKQMEDFTVSCVATDKSYKQYSDKIVSSCGTNSATSLKSQKACIDKIKELIKAPSKKHPPIHKFYSLKLLNKCVLKKNSELNLYIEQKLTQRLSILAEFNNDPNEKSAQALLTRGKHIFGPDEKDTQNSANFLIILLDCLEKWALTFQFEEADIDDTKSSKSKMSSSVQSGDKFYKVYTKLLAKGVKFPSTFKQAQDKSPGLSRKSTLSSQQPQNMDQDSLSNNEFGSASPNRLMRSKTSAKEAQSERSRSPFQPQSAATSITSRSFAPEDNQSTSSSLTPDKKIIINNLKKKMQKVKEASKNAQKFNEKMSLPGADAVMADAVELVTLRDLFTESKNNCEESINQLMSDEVSPHISNSEKLLEKMFGYQEILNKALTSMNKQIEQQQQIEQQVYSASKQGPKKDEKKPDIPKDFNDDNDVIQPRKVEQLKKQDSSQKKPQEEVKSASEDKSSQLKKPVKESKAVDEVNQIMQDNKTIIDQTTVVDSMQDKNNQNEFQDFDFKNKDLGEIDQPTSARQVLQTNNQVSNPYEFNDFSQNKEMFQTHVQKEGQNAFGVVGNDEQWFTATSQQQPPQTDFNFNFEKPVDDFEFSSSPAPQIAPKIQKQLQAEEEEKVPESEKKFDEKLDDNDGLRISEIDPKDYDTSDPPPNDDENKNQLTFASSPNRKGTFGKLSDINQSKPVNLENKGDITFNDDIARENASDKKEEIKQEIDFDAQPKKDAQQLDFFQFDNAGSAPVQDVKANKPPVDDFAFEFDDGGQAQDTEERQEQDPASSLFNFDSNTNKSTGRFEAQNSKNDLGIDLSNMPKSPNHPLNETGQFGFNADTFRKQDEIEEETKKIENSPVKKLIVQPPTSKFGDTQENILKQEDSPTHLSSSPEQESPSKLMEKQSPSIPLQKQTQIMQTSKVEQPGDKQDEDEDISSGISGFDNGSIRKVERKISQNAIENDQFEEEFVAQAKSSLDESILEPDSQDIEVQKKLQKLRQKLKSEHSCARWWAQKAENVGGDASEQVSNFANNVLPQQLQPMNEIKNQLEDMQEYQQEILKLKSENKKFVDQQASGQDQNIKYEQNIKDLNDQLEAQKLKMTEQKMTHTYEIEAKDQILKQTNLELDLEKEQLQKYKDSEKEERALELREHEEQLEQKDMKIEELLDKVTKQMQSYDDLEQKYKVDVQEQHAVISTLKAEIEMMEMPKPVAMQEVESVQKKKEEVAGIDFNQLLPNKQASQENSIESPAKMQSIDEFQSPAKELPNNELKSPVLSKIDADFVFSPEIPQSNQKQDSLVQNLNFGSLLSEQTQQETQEQKADPPKQPLDFKDFSMPAPAQQQKQETANFNDFSFVDLGIPTDKKVFEEKKNEETKLNTSRSSSKIPMKPNMFEGKRSSRASNDIGLLQQKSSENITIIQPKPVEEIKSILEEESKQVDNAKKPEPSVNINAFAQNQLQGLVSIEPPKIAPVEKFEPIQEQQIPIDKIEEQNKTQEEIKPQIMPIIEDKALNIIDQKSLEPVSSLPLQMPQPPKISIPQVQDNPRKSNPFEIPTPKQMLAQSKEEASKESTEKQTSQQNAQKMMQTLQQDLLRQKLSSFHINSLLQGNKCVIYEDVNVKIGCIRKSALNNGVFKAEIKIFLRNHNQAKMNINNIDLQFECTNQGQNSNIIKVIRSSQELPLQSPPSQPLVQNQTLDLDLEIQWPPPYQQGFRNLTFDNFKMVLQYELENKRRSGFLPVNLPFNILNLLQPHQAMNSGQFRDLWQQISIDSNIQLQHRVQEQRSFQLDLQKAQNMAKLKQIISLNNTCFAIVPSVEAQPNWVCFASMVPNSNQQSQQTILLVKIMLTKDGKECQAQIKGCRDTLNVSLQVFDTILQMISKQ